MRQVDVAIIGAGTAGLSARREVERVTGDYVVIDDGPLGTTCARVGCMPSKVLLQVARDFHRRHVFAQQGISGAEGLSIDGRAVMEHVRALRDRFAGGVRRSMGAWTEDHLVRKRARFVDAHTFDLEGERLRAERIVLATGSRPIVPRAWEAVRHRLIDSSAFFELETLPARVAVIGLGVIGLELGQALARLGVEVQALSLDKAYGGLSDPELQEVAHELFGAEMAVHLSEVAALEEEGGDLVVHLADGTSLRVDAALVSVGRRPNVDGLGLEALDVPLEHGMPPVDPTTLRIPGTPWYLAGDANSLRPILHEAADQGRIAGFNAARPGSEDQCFQQRTPLAITFSSPNIARVGAAHRALVASGADFVTGRVSFVGQGRAIVKMEEGGALHVYADRTTGALLGAELLAPGGEHLAHLLAWAMAAGLSVRETLSLPFYHPVLEEGLRSALRAAARQMAAERSALEVLRCADPPVGCRA